MHIDISRKGIQYLLIVTAAVAVFMDYLDSSIVTIILPNIVADYHIPNSVSSWVLVSYLLSIGCSLIIFGKIADRTGKYKLIFTSGFVLFTVSSLFCGIAPSIQILILFRFLQGFAAALMVSTATSIINLYLPEKLQAFAAGIIATGGGIALAAGPGVGGLLSQFLSWNWVFFINIPIGILGIIAALILIPKDTKVSKPATRFDSIGSALLAMTLVSLLAGLEFGSQNMWPWYSIVLLAIVPFLGFLFIRYEFKNPDPVLSVRLLKNRTVMFASFSSMFTTVAYFGLIFILPFYLVSKGFSISLIGLIMLIPPAGIALAGIPSGLLSIKFGCKQLCTAGTCLQAVGMGILVFGMINSLFVLVIVGLVMGGIGSGFNEGPSIRRITVHGPKDLQGSAGGLVFTVLNVGCVLGVSLFSVVAAAVSKSNNFGEWGIVMSCIVGIVFAVLAVITSELAKDTIKY